MQEHQRKQDSKKHLRPPVSAELQQLSCAEVVCPATDQFVKTLPPSFITTVNTFSSFRVTAAIQSDSSVWHSGALRPDPSSVPFSSSGTGAQNWVACTGVTVYFLGCWRSLGLPRCRLCSVFCLAPDRNTMISEHMSGWAEKQKKLSI